MRDILFEYPDSNTVIIKKKRSIVGVFFVLIPLIAVGYFVKDFAYGEDTSLGEIFRALVEPFGRINEISLDLYGIMDLFPFIITLAFMLLLVWMMVFGLGLLVPRKTTVNGSKGRIARPFARDIEFGSVESIYTRHIHDDATRKVNLYLVGLKFEDGSKHFFGTCSSNEEALQAAKTISVIIGKSTEVRA